MNDYTELKKLAEAAGSGQWGYDGSYVCPARTEDGTTYVESWRAVADCYQPENTKFIAAANPAAVLALIAENKALRIDKERLDALESSFWDVRFNSSQNGDAGDSNVSVEIVGHWMDKPFERVVGENYNENLRAAIDQAITAPDYPPERPEYPEFDAAMSKEPKA